MSSELRRTAEGPLSAALIFAVLYLAISLVRDQGNVVALVVGSLLSAVVVFVLGQVLGRGSRVTIAGGSALAAVAAVIAALV